MNFKIVEGEATGRPHGLSYYVYDNEGFTGIPSDIRNLLTQKQFDFFVHYPASIEPLLSEIQDVSSNIPSLLEWIKSLKTSKLSLEIHLAEECHEYMLEEIWFRFHIAENWNPGISLYGAHDDNQFYTPATLKNIFNSIGEINHHGYLSRGGLMTPHSMFTEDGKLENFYEFYSVYNGDSYCYDQNSKVYFYDHETDNGIRNDPSNVKYKEDLNSFLIRYFESLIKHQEI
jgi:hypothetical protein